MREFRLLEIVAEILSNEDIEIPAPVHDAAYVKYGEKYLVFTTDTVNERSDFPKFMLPREMGHMALAVTLSDIAACGAKPLFFLNSISLKEFDQELFREVILGMRDLAKKYGVKIIGGDIDFSGVFSIAGFAVGEAERVITRNGAESGDRVYITGELGKAQLCLEMLENGFKRNELPFAKSLYTPEPKINEGMVIARFASSITDISDSLAISLHQIARQSGVRIVIEEEKIPLTHLINYSDRNRALELFLYGGGDYELLFTAKNSSIGYEIGYVEEGEGAVLRTREGFEEIQFSGYSHF
jgi:thiamine-monophosphate kinase